ncbi:MAG TPA: universal stress protein [Actinomycetota bacterium]|nr:universal stress protein [Actinomycetota bacterium]
MRLVLASEGSAEANAAASLLIAGARRDEVSVTVLSVAALGGSSHGWPPDYLKEAVARDLERAEKTAAAVSDRLARSGFRTTARTGNGHPGTEVLRELEREDVGLAVLGYGTHRWLGTRLLGSTGSYVLQEAPTPVLLVHRAPPSLEHLHVLVATDGSPGALAAASMVPTLLDPARCSLEVVSASVMPPTWAAAVDSGLVAPYVGSALTPDAFEELIGAERAQTETIASRTAEQLRAEGFRTDVQALFGPVKSSLLRETEYGHFDLVVVGSRGLGPIRRALMGSVSEAMVNHTPATLVGRRRSPSGED